MLLLIVSLNFYPFGFFFGIFCSVVFLFLASVIFVLVIFLFFMIDCVCHFN